MLQSCATLRYEHEASLVLFHSVITENGWPVEIKGNRVIREWIVRPKHDIKIWRLRARFLSGCEVEFQI